MRFSILKEFLNYGVVELVLGMGGLLFAGSWVLLRRLPLFLILALFACSFLVCLLVGGLFSGLLGFLVFISYVSGVMVLFLYSLRLCPIQKHVYRSKDSEFRWVYTVISAVLLFVGRDELDSNCCLFSREVIVHYISLQGWYVVFLYMVLVLFYVMVVVCNICDKKATPLREMKAKKIRGSN